MLLPDNVQPELSIYYNGAVVIRSLKQRKKQSVMELFSSVKAENAMSFSTFILSLDWLYLIGVAVVNAQGMVELCS